MAECRPDQTLRINVGSFRKFLRPSVNFTYCRGNVLNVKNHISEIILRDS